MSLPTWMTPLDADAWLTGTIGGTIHGNDHGGGMQSSLLWYSDTDEVRIVGDVLHSRGLRRIESTHKLSELLDSLASTKAGRRAMLEAIVRHES